MDLSVLDENDCNSSVGETTSFASKILTVRGEGGRLPPLLLNYILTVIFV